MSSRKLMRYAHSICWGNPYTKPPDGLPHYLVRVESISHRLEGRLKDKFHKILERLAVRGIHSYVIGFSYYNDAPRRTWSREAKLKNRRRRLRKRLEKKFSIPEILEQFYQEAIAKNPSYYGEGEI